DARHVAGARGVGHQGTEEALAAREATGKGNRSRGRRRQGVGGLPTRVDVGEQGQPWTQPSKGGPCRGDLQEGPKSNALTLSDRAPGLVKVAGRAPTSPLGGRAGCGQSARPDLARGREG